MKKSWRLITVAVLSLILILALFSACGNKTFVEKYGITFSDKVVTYDGNEYSNEITVDNSVLNGKTYTVDYTYTLNGAAVSGTSFKEAGTYSVNASVLVAGESQPTVLTAKLVINKMDVQIEMGNLFLRQGQGISSLGTPSFQNVTLAGSDTMASLGGLSYEVYNGSTKVTDLTALKPTAKESEAYSVQAVFTTAPKNYNVTFTNGKLYVLSGADYDTANKLKGYIDGAPTTTTIDTFDYSAMNTFAASASYIIEKYPSTSAIQRLMCGVVNVDTIKSLYKTASSRLNAIYDLEGDIDSTIGSVAFTAAYHYANDNRKTTDDDYISEFQGDKKTSISSVEYNDIFAFTITIKDTSKYKLQGVTIRNKYYSISALSSYGLTQTPGSGNEVVYTIGAVNSSAPSTGHYGTGTFNKGISSGGVSVKNEVLGALDGKNYITVTPDVVPIYTLKVKNDTSTSFVTSTSTASSLLPAMSSMTIISKGTTYYTASSSSFNDTTKIPDASTAKLTIYPKTGYVLSEVEIGDTIVTADKFENNSYEFNVDEKISNSNNEIIITVKFVESFSFEVAVNNKGIANANKNGVFAATAGTVTLENVSETTVPTMTKDKSLTLTVTPAANYVLSGLTIVGKKSVDTDVTYNLITDPKFEIDNNGRITIDLGAETELLSTTTVKINATFSKSYNLDVKGSRVGNGEVAFTNNGRNVFTSKYGKITILDTEDVALDKLYDGQKYVVMLESESGYVPKSIKINNVTLYTFTIANDEYYRFRTLNYGAEIYMANVNVADNYLVRPQLSAEFGALTASTKFITLAATNLDAGAKLTIDVQYDAYYYVDFDLGGLPTGGTDAAVTKIPVKMYSADGTKTSFLTSAETVPSGHVVDSAYATIKVGTTYYAYYNGDSGTEKLGVNVTPANTKTLENFEASIGKETFEYTTVSAERLLRATISDAIVGSPESATILPGGTITISVSANNKAAS